MRSATRHAQGSRGGPGQAAAACRSQEGCPRLPPPLCPPNWRPADGLPDALPLCRPSAQELARFQAFLQKQGATQLSDMVRGRQRLAYPIKR